MRPSVLDSLFAAITALPGIGDKVARLYRRLLGREETPRVVDLLSACFELPFEIGSGLPSESAASSCAA